MRTTLTLDEDVAVLLRRAVARRKVAFKEVVNEALRAGLTASARPLSRKRVRTRTFDGGELRVDVTSVSEALAVGEGEAWK